MMEILNYILYCYLVGPKWYQTRFDPSSSKSNQSQADECKGPEKIYYALILTKELDRSAMGPIAERSNSSEFDKWMNEWIVYLSL